MTALAGKVPDYATLLKKTLPRVIHSEEQNEHFLEILEQLERRSAKWTTDEKDLAELLSVLIFRFEEENANIGDASPTEVLQELMDANDPKQKDLADVFGAESTVSAIMHGKRDLTRDHIKRLSERFHVSPAVFF